MRLNSFRARKVVGSLKKWAPALSKNHSIDALKLITSVELWNCAIGIEIGNGLQLGNDEPAGKAWRRSGNF